MANTAHGYHAGKKTHIMRSGLWDCELS